MAYRLTTQRISASLRPALFTKPTLTLVTRSFSSTPSTAQASQPEEPRKKALSIIDALPGNSLLSKTGFLTVGTSLATYTVSKEIYVANEETIALVAFAGLVTLLYRIAREPYNEFAQGYINNMINIFREARQEHKGAVKTHIDQVAELKDIVDVTKNMFAMSKQMAEMEAKIFELKQEVNVAQEAKSVLDSWVRHETSLREREQRELAASVMQKARQELSKPEVQNQILEQCFADVEKLSTARA
ncbi:atp4 subunit B of the stator stalk of mitochondrial F1F0 ATP synthase [Dispira simplex]|nr:atp4 subunit B of the stator stalk of mitochondrial F1F0 ATP synthase [Dispira simplex]